jgi:hypothetical protein
MVVHACKPSTWEAEAGGSLVQGQHGLHSKILSQNKIKQTKKESEKTTYIMEQNICKLYYLTKVYDPEYTTITQQ